MQKVNCTDFPIASPPQSIEYCCVLRGWHRNMFTLEVASSLILFPIDLGNEIVAAFNLNAVVGLKDPSQSLYQENSPSTDLWSILLATSTFPGVTTSLQENSLSPQKVQHQPQPIVAITYSMCRCLHHISAAFRFRFTSSESTRLGSFTSMTAFCRSSYSTRKSGT